MWKSGAGRCNHLVSYLQMSGSYLNKMGRFRNSSRSYNYQGTCFLFKLAYLQKANPAKPIVRKNPWAPKGNLCNDMSWSPRNSHSLRIYVRRNGPGTSGSRRWKIQIETMKSDRKKSSIEKTWWRHQMETFSALLIGKFNGEFNGHRWISLPKASDAEL